jgi:hypothetical protein
MKDELDNQTGDLFARSGGAERQARLKARREAAGYRQTTSWLHGESERIGYERGLAAAPLQQIPQEVVDVTSYTLGWLHGEQDRLVSVICASCGVERDRPVRSGDYYAALDGQPLQVWYCSEECAERFQW